MKFSLLLGCITLTLLSFGQTEDTWDTYIRDYNGRPASTMLNMSLAGIAPIKEFGYILITGVTYTDCRKDGFPSKSEFDRLYKLDDAIIGLLNIVRVNKYAGSFTSQCQRLNYVYVKDTNNLRVVFADFYKTKYPDYKPFIDMKSDQKWDTYLNFLYPNEALKENMSNLKMVLKLSAAGDSLKEARNVNHWLNFKTAANRSSFIDYAKQNGFKPESARLVKDAPLRYQLQISRVDQVDLTSINKITIALSAEVKRMGGTYDGWETVVIK